MSKEIVKEVIPIDIPGQPPTVVPDEIKERFNVRSERNIIKKEHEWELNMLAILIRDLNYYNKIKSQGINENWFFNKELKEFFKVYADSATRDILLTKKLFIEKVIARHKIRRIENPIIFQYELFYDDLLAFDFHENEFPIYIETFRKYYLLNVIQEKVEVIKHDIKDNPEESESRKQSLLYLDAKLTEIQSIPDGEIIDFDKLDANGFIGEQIAIKPKINIHEDLDKISFNIRSGLSNINNLYKTGSAFSFCKDNTTISNINRSYFDEVLSASFDFVYYKETDKGIVERKVTNNIPKKIISDTIFYNADQADKVPELYGISNFPILNLDGTINAKSGYDKKTKYIIKTDEDIEIPETPDFEYLDYLFSDFPFESKSDLTAFYSYVLSMLILPVFDQNIPLFYCNAPKGRTGKNLLLNLGMIIVHGQKFPAIGQLHKDEELEKRLTARALAAEQINFFDELPDTIIKRKSLNSYLTNNQTYTGRLLGKSENISLKWKTVFAMAGNNSQFAYELSERMIKINLDAKCKSPGRRNNFKIDYIENYVLKDRSRILGNFIAILKQYINNNKPDMKLENIGNFSQWNNLVLGALKFHGYEYQNQKNDDNDESIYENLIIELHHCFQNRDFTANDIIFSYSRIDSLSEAIKDLSNDYPKLISFGGEINAYDLRSVIAKINNKQASYVNSRNNQVDLKFVKVLDKSGKQLKDRTNKGLYKVLENEIIKHEPNGLSIPPKPVESILSPITAN